MKLACMIVILVLLGAPYMGKEKAAEPTIDLKQYNVVDNDILFVHDPRSELMLDDLLRNPVLLGLYHDNPYFALRENNEIYYTIYSITGDRVCYVFINASLYTGIDFYLFDYVIYPYMSDAEREFVEANVLEIDLPHSILGK